jgi:hypothetical protein
MACRRHLSIELTNFLHRTVPELAKEFGKKNSDITWGITLVSHTQFSRSLSRWTQRRGRYI